MNITDTLGSSVQNVITHPLRSIMTLIALVIGIFAVVVMFSSVYGIKTLITANMENMGFNNSVIIYPDRSQAMRHAGHGLSRRQFLTAPRQVKPLDYGDYLALKYNVEHKYLFGVVEKWYQNTGFSREESIRLIATNSDFFESKNYLVKNGRIFNTIEEKNANKVCLLGAGIVEKYFKNREVIGERIVLGNNIYSVIGIIDEIKTADSPIIDFNSWERQRDLNTVYIPLSTGISHLKSDKSVDYLSMTSYDSDSYRYMMNRLRQVLLANHNMAHNFGFRDIGSFIAIITNEMEDFMQKWNITLTTIASISLLVGGLGLFSTMLISIRERLLEIGIRKSVGASPANIFSHFLIESLIFSLFSAGIAIILATGLVKLISVTVNFDFPLPLEGILLGTGFSLIVGILSGIYPALKAAEINPVQAIYYNES